jgi:hypothetical protein
VALPNIDTVTEIDFRALRRRAVRVCDEARRSRLANRVPPFDTMAEPAARSDRCAPPPSRRARRAEMSRVAFLRLVAAWVGGLAGLLAVVLSIRMFG